ncbi:MAG TPA: hypothetical protein VH916_11745, partial [Dehalococcoidia bacterium]
CGRRALLVVPLARRAHAMRPYTLGAGVPGSVYARDASAVQTDAANVGAAGPHGVAAANALR